jgi:glycine/D-amino acid oxidase-like deaminating enzyme
MRVAVVGGGLFGCTAAIHAARAGHEVHLYEARHELVCGATAATYSRLHRGYHYPRSPETGAESRQAEASFREEYGASVIDSGRQFYVVPPSVDNLVTSDEFSAFLDKQGLPYAAERGVFEVREPRINLAVLQALVRQKVEDAGVFVRLNCPAPAMLRYAFDAIVVAAYSGLNDSLEALHCAPRPYKFQVVERPVALLPASLRDASVVAIDGPFGCVDPLDGTPLHVLGHVVHTVHASNTGNYPEIPKHLAPVIDRGLIRNPEFTRFKNVVHDLAQYMPGLKQAVHVGSSYTVRAVLAHQEATDRRPTLVTRHDDQVVSVFSGKLGTAVKAAQDVLHLIDSREKVAA